MFFGGQIFWGITRVDCTAESCFVSKCIARYERIRWQIWFSDIRFLSTSVRCHISIVIGTYSQCTVVTGVPYLAKLSYYSVEILLIRSIAPTNVSSIIDAHERGCHNDVCMMIPSALNSRNKLSRGVFTPLSRIRHIWRRFISAVMSVLTIFSFACLKQYDHWVFKI